jgi:hypothetical protein
MFWIGLLIGIIIGVVALGIMRGSSHDDDCRSCKSYYTGIIRDKDDVIHGLKSTKGKLAREVQSLTFRNSGYNAR